MAMVTSARVIFLLSIFTLVRCETGYEAWLRYRPVPSDQKQKYSEVPEVVVTTDESPVINSCVSELSRGLSGLLSVNVKQQKFASNQSSIVLSTIKAIGDLIPAEDIPKDLKTDGFHIVSVKANNVLHIVIVSPTDVGLLYGTFALLRKISLYENVIGLNETSNPFSPLRY